MSKKLSTRWAKKSRRRRTRGAVRKLGVIVRDGRSIAVRLFTKTKRGPELQFREKWSRRPSALSLGEAARIAERLRTGALFTEAELAGGAK